ncbi:hypothetical protein Vadar_002481 [Vaccinium darrowii]|uniref:Uncharacterized protein n=1 Tax=Vaccinium darrowii TaxID=229202 RepID=A0ACB7WWZ5_9ERIC|nr:hypothetical protein Vadar_002481 [Vaccinium darrowii]
MICWPRSGDQQIICKYCCNNWGIGAEIGGGARREEVEKLVRELMEGGGEKSEDLRKKAMEWKRLAFEATKSRGFIILGFGKIGERCSGSSLLLFSECKFRGLKPSKNWKIQVSTHPPTTTQHVRPTHARGVELKVWLVGAYVAILIEVCNVTKKGEPFRTK